MSEENKLDQENMENQEPAQSPESWETQLQAHANQLLAQRIGPLRSEIERLQVTINEISARLLEQSNIEPDPQETSGLLDYVKSWFSQSSSKAEEEFNMRLEHEKADSVAAALAKAKEDFEEEYKDRLKQAVQDWERAAQLDLEATMEKRLETARLEWESAAQRSGEEVFQRRLEQACAEAAAVTRRESEAQIEDLREQLEASRKALTLAVASAQSSSARSTNFDMLKSAVDEIDSQRTQSETLTSLVRRASQFAPRVVFFVVKGGDAVGWKANGFENGLNDETVRLLSVPTQNPSLLHDALSAYKTAHGKSSSPGENSAVLGLYGSPAPESTIAVPLVVRGKAAAVLYADSGTQSENSINTAAIETLMRVASMGIELLPSRRGFEPPRPTVLTGQLVSPASATSTPAPPAAPATPVAEQRPAIRPQEREEVNPAEETEKRDDHSAEPAFTPQSAPPLKERITEDLTLPPGVAESFQEPPQQETVSPGSAVKTLTDEIPRPDFSGRPLRETKAIEITEETEDDEEAKVNWSASLTPPASVSFKEDAESINQYMASAPTIPIRVAQEAAENLQSNLESSGLESSGLESSGLESSGAGQPPINTFLDQPPVAPPAAEKQRVAQPPVSVPIPASETEQRAHNDARRFARLLVSEIKLYNAAKVNEGRRNFDLYDRLRDEIDRSRKVYDKRVSPAVAARFDYFYDELVQTLAEGDPSKLGPGCPGPVVLAS